MANLYELSANLRNLADELIDFDDQTMLDTIEGSTQMMKFEDKVSSVVKFTRNIESDTTILDAEIKRLTERKQAYNNKVKSLKQYLQTCMEVAGVEKVKLPTFTVSVQNNPASLTITDEKLIPDKYLTVIPMKFEPNKQALKEALKAGNEITGACLTQGKSLRIR